MSERLEQRLKQNLQGWQIFFIVISSVIASGIFSNGGAAIQIAGPGGALFAFMVIGVIAICMAECLSELTQLFPAPNAIFEYVKAFVDEDLAWVVGIAYWFTYSSIFAAQNLTAANLALYWSEDPTNPLHIIIFYFITPGIMLCINLVGVGAFGWIEAVGGILKIVLVVGTTIALYVMAKAKNYWSGEEVPIAKGFQFNPGFVHNKGIAICYIIPMAAFGYIGIETVAVTAFEARTSKSLRLPSQIIAYVTVLLYFFCMLGQCLNVPWDHDHLPLKSGDSGLDSKNTKDLQHPSSSSLTILAFWIWKQKPLAGFLNGAMIFSVLSGGNTALYTASRTLYGLALAVPETSLLGRQLHGFSIVAPKTGVPVRALIFSALAFFWLPFVGIHKSVIEVFQIASSVSGLIVWAAISFAYLRYYLWLKKCERHLVGDYAQYRRGTRTYKPFTLLATLQPLPAIVAVAGSITVIAFCSTTWWNTKVTFNKVATGYSAPLILFVLFILFKLINRRLWVRTGTDFEELSRRLNTLKWYKRDEISPEEERLEATRTLNLPLANLRLKDGESESSAVQAESRSRSNVLA